jgi:hypothetical protein
LFTRTQKIRQTASVAWDVSHHSRSVWSEASQLLTGQLNDLMHSITNAITRVRRETDLRAGSASSRISQRERRPGTQGG